MEKSLYERFVEDNVAAPDVTPSRNMLWALKGYIPDDMLPEEPKITRSLTEEPPPSKIPEPDLAPSHLGRPDYASTVDSPDYIDLVKRGLEAGTYELLALPGVFGSWLAHRLRLESVAETTAEWADFWLEKAEALKPKEMDLFNVVDNPEVLLNAGWWVYNLAEMAPSMLLTLGAGGLLAKGGAKLATHAAVKKLTARRAAGEFITRGAVDEARKSIVRAGKIGAWIGGGVTGGAVEAQQTYREVLKNGGTEEEAARAAELMFFGVGALNAFGTEFILRKAGNTFLSKVGRVFGSAAVEGITEGLEEPWEVISRLGAAIITGKDLPDDIEGMFYDSLKGALTVFPLAAVMGGGAEVATTVSNAKLDRLAKEIEKNKTLAKDYYLKKIIQFSDDKVAEEVSTTGKQRRLFREPPTLFDQPMATQAEEVAATVEAEIPKGEKLIDTAEAGVKSDVQEIEDIMPPGEPPGGPAQPPTPGPVTGPAPAGETAPETGETPLGFVPFPQFWDASPEEQAYAYKEALDFISTQDPGIQQQLKEAYDGMLMEHWENIKIEVAKVGKEVGLAKPEIDELMERFSQEAQASFDNAYTHRQILDEILSNPPFSEEGVEEGGPGPGGVVEPAPVIPTGAEGNPIQPAGGKVGRVMKKIFGTKTPKVTPPEAKQGPGEAIKEPRLPSYYQDSENRYIYVAPAYGGGFGWYRTEDLEKKGRRTKPRTVKGDKGEVAIWSTKELAKEALDTYASEQGSIRAPEGFQKKVAAKKERAPLGEAEVLKAEQEQRQELAKRQPYLLENIRKWGGIATKHTQEILDHVQARGKGGRKIIIKGLDLFRKGGKEMDELVALAIESRFLVPDANASPSELEEQLIEAMIADLYARKPFSEQSKRDQERWRVLNKKLKLTPKEETEARKKLQNQMKFLEEKIREVGSRTGRVATVEEMAERSVREAEEKQYAEGEAEAKRDQLPPQLLVLIDESETRIEDVQIVQEGEDTKPLIEKWGLPNAIDVGFGLFGSVAGRFWVDETGVEEGYEGPIPIKAYEPPYALKKKLDKLVEWMRANVTPEEAKANGPKINAFIRGKANYAIDLLDNPEKFWQEATSAVPPAGEATQEERRTLREALTRDGTATRDDATVTIKRDEAGTYYVKYKSGVSTRLFNNPDTDENWTKDQRTEAIDYAMEVIINGPPRLPPLGAETAQKVEGFGWDRLNNKAQELFGNGYVPLDETQKKAVRDALKAEDAAKEGTPRFRDRLVDDLQDRAIKALGLQKWARWSNYKTADDAKIKEKMIELAKATENFDDLYYEKDGEIYSWAERERLAGPKEQGKAGHPLLDWSDYDALVGIGYRIEQIIKWHNKELGTPEEEIEKLIEESKKKRGIPTDEEGKRTKDLETKARIAARERWRAAVNAETEKRGIKKLMFGPEATATPQWAKDMYETIYHDELDKRKEQLPKAKRVTGKLFEEKEEGFALTPTEPTTEEKIAEGVRKGQLKKGEKSKERAKLPEGKRKAPTTGKQQGLLPEEKGQIDLVDEIAAREKAEKEKAASEKERSKLADDAAQASKDILDELKIRTHSVPEDTPISPGTLINNMVKNEHFNAAKSGDVEEAQKLVEALVTKDQITFAKKFGSEAIYVPVVADETEGKNKVPLAFAFHVASKTGAKVEANILQKNRVGRRGKNAFARLFRRPEFEGKVKKGAIYVIFDDALVTGGTVAELANHIVSNGGVVVGVMALAKTPGSWYGISIDQNTFNSIRERFGHAIEEILGIHASALTDSEARFILKTYRNVDSFREAATKAGYRQFYPRIAEALPVSKLGSIDPAKYEKLKKVLDKLWTDNEAIGKRDGLAEEQIEDTFADLFHKVLGRDQRLQPYAEKWAGEMWPEEAKDAKDQRRTKVPEGPEPDSGGPPAAGGIGTSGPGGGRDGIRPGLRVADEEHLPEPRDQIPSGQYNVLGDEQRFGVNLALQAFDNGKAGFLLADGTGVGKTMQELLIAHLWGVKSKKKSLIVVPNEQILESRFKADASKMGVPLTNIEFTTYVGLRLKKGGQGKYGVVVFDEAHNLKNMESEKTLAANEITADHRIFATATPMDRPTGAAYFLSKITGIPENRIHHDLGFEVVDVWDDTEKRMKKFTRRFPGVTWARVMESIMAYRARAVREGTILRREYPFFGAVRIQRNTLPTAAASEQRLIQMYWDRKIANAVKPSTKRFYRGQKTQELSRWSDSKKVSWIGDQVVDDLNNGYRVVIVAHGIEDTIIKGLQKKVPQLIGGVVEYLKQRGITDFAKIYGPNQTKKLKEIRRFQSDQVHLAIMTPESGGAGVDLDDVHGDKPRRVYYASPSFSGDTFQQVLGRFSRRNTASPAEVFFTMWDDSEGDTRRAIVVQKKIDTLRRIQEGEDVDKAIGFEDTEEQGDSGEAPMIHDTPQPPKRSTVKGRIDEIRAEVRAAPLPLNIRPFEETLLDRIEQGKDPVVSIREEKIRKQFHTQLWLTWRAQATGIAQRPISAHVDLVVGGGDLGIVFQIQRPYGKLNFDSRDGEFRILDTNDPMTDAQQSGDIVSMLNQTKKVTAKSSTDEYTNFMMRSKDVMNGNPARAMSNELIQNSKDATKGVKNPTITIRWNRADNIIEIEDNGKGMSAKEFKENFLRLGSINKDSDDAGAFGLAKSYILTYPPHGECETTKNGVTTRFKWQDIDIALQKEIEGEVETTGKPNGTRIRLFLDEKRQPAFDWWTWGLAIKEYQEWTKVSGLKIRQEDYYNAGQGLSGGAILMPDAKDEPELNVTMYDPVTKQFSTFSQVSWFDYQRMKETHPTKWWDYSYPGEKINTGWDAEPMWRKPLKFEYLGNKVTAYFVQISDSPYETRKMTKDDRGWYHPHIKVYNKGMLAPTNVFWLQQYNFFMAEKENFAIYINFDETVRPDVAELAYRKAMEGGNEEKIRTAREYSAKMMDAYPWISNRTKFSSSAERTLIKEIEAVTRQLKEEQIRTKMADFKEMVDRSPVVNGMKVLIPFKSEDERKAGEKIVADNMEFFGMWVDYIKLASDMMADMQKEFPGLGIPTRKIYLGMQPGSRGFVPTQKVINEFKSPDYEFISFNPLGVDAETLAWMTAKQVDHTKGEYLLNRAAMIAHATVHEWAHLLEESHGEAHEIVMSVFYSNMTHLRVAILEDKAYEILERFKERIDSIEKDIGSLGKEGTVLSQHLGTVVGPEWIAGRGQRALNEDATSTRGDREEGPYNRGAVTSALLGRLGSAPHMQAQQQPPTGAQVAWDYEQNRTWAMKLFEMVDPAKIKIANSVNTLQKRIQGLVGAPSKRRGLGLLAYDKRLKRSQVSDELDRAMFLYRDSANGDPDIFNRFRIQANMQLNDPRGYLQTLNVSPDSDFGKRILSGEHKIYLKKILKLLDVAERMNPEQKTFVNDMASLFRDAGGLANRHGLLHSFVENYVRRVYKVRKGAEIEPFGQGHAFKTKFGPAQPRSYQYVLEAILDGYELGTEGITNAYKIYMDELIKVISNKHFIKMGMRTLDANGNALFTPKKKDGYRKLHGFTAWVWAGDVWAEKEIPGVPALHINEYGKRFFATRPQELPEMWKVGRKYFDDEQVARQYARDRGKDPVRDVQYVKAKDTSTFFERVDLYAPTELAEIINKMTQTDTFFSTPAFNSVLRFNSGIKAWVLMSSFFHHLAGTRSWVFGVHHGWRWSKVAPWSAYKAGMDKIMDLHPLIVLGVKNGLTIGEIADFAELELRNSKGYTEQLLTHFGLETPLKVVQWFKFKRESWADSLFKKFFAGLKAEAFAIEYTHTLQQAMDQHRLGQRQSPPDPDRIAEAVAKLINDDFGGLHLRRMGRNPTLQNLFRLTFLAPDWTESNFRYVAATLGLENWINKTVGDLKTPPEYKAIARKFLLRVMLRIAVITILAQLLLNGKDDTEEMLKEQMLSNRFNRFRWTELDITRLYEMLGMDPDTRMTFSIGGHFFDPLKVIAPFKLMKGKGSPFWRVGDALFSGSDWAERPFTSISELVETGKTTKKSYHQRKEGEVTRLPSVIINQLTQMQPIQVGHLIRYLQGEEDGLTAVLTSMGTQVHKAWKPPLETPIKPKMGKDPLVDQMRELSEKADEEGRKIFAMGPPSRTLTIKGKSYELERPQYDRYIEESSAIVRRKLENRDMTGWTDQRKATVFERVVRDARKRVAGKIKREIMLEEKKKRDTEKPEAILGGL